jgi:hypothetical protein
MYVHDDITCAMRLHDRSCDAQTINEEPKSSLRTSLPIGRAVHVDVYDIPCTLYDTLHGIVPALGLRYVCRLSSLLLFFSRLLV